MRIFFKNIKLFLLFCGINACQNNAFCIKIVRCKIAQLGVSHFCGKPMAIYTNR